MLDLCKLFNVKEGEEFKIEYIDGHISNVKYRVINNQMESSSIGGKYDGDYSYSFRPLNRVVEIKNIIKLPKKKEFSQETLNFFKCIDKKYKWIAKDKDGEVYIYIDKPKKEDKCWNCNPYYFFKPLDTIKDSLFTEIQWEDEEPIRIDDYVDR